MPVTCEEMKSPKRRPSPGACRRKT
jgi:hypothetical protein